MLCSVQECRVGDFVRVMFKSFKDLPPRDNLKTVNGIFLGVHEKYDYIWLYFEGYLGLVSDHVPTIEMISRFNDATR